MYTIVISESQRRLIHDTLEIVVLSDGDEACADVVFLMEAMDKLKTKHERETTDIRPL